MNDRYPITELPAWSKLFKELWCPICDGSGGTAILDCHGEAYQEQCQWCDEFDTLIKAAEVKHE